MTLGIIIEGSEYENVYAENRYAGLIMLAVVRMAVVMLSSCWLL
jgi:hypothetical protein